MYIYFSNVSPNNNLDSVLRHYPEEGSNKGFVQDNDRTIMFYSVCVIEKRERVRVRRKSEMYKKLWGASISASNFNFHNTYIHAV